MTPASKFYTKDHPVEKPEDLKGLKIRVKKVFQHLIWLIN